MSFSNLLNQLKKRFLRKRRWLTLISLTFILGLGVAMSSKLAVDKSLPTTASTALQNITESVTASSTPIQDNQREEMILHLNKMTDKLNAVIKTVYLCGEETQNIGRLDPQEILKRMELDPTLQAVIDPEGNVILTQTKEDLSPNCKKNAYIGLDKDGNLTLFEGPPSNQKTIRTFFQMDIRYLETSLPRETVQQLDNGIKVSDLEEYNSVLSTFSDYAKEETKKVMKPTL